MKKKIVILLKIIISLLLISLLFYKLGIKNSLYLFTTINFWKLIPFFITIYFIFFAGAFNIWILLKNKTKIGYTNFVRQYFYSYLLSFFIPGQLGDASLVLIFKKKFNTPMKITAAAYSVDKIITLIIYLIAASIGIIVYISALKKLIFIFAIVILIAIILFVINTKLLTSSKISTGLIFKIKNYWLELLLFRHDLPILLLNFGITILKWLALGLGLWFVFTAFGVRVDILAILTIPIITTFVGYLPVSIGGIGTIEVTAIYLFSIIGVDKVVVLNVYILSRICQYASCLPLFIFYLSTRSPVLKKLTAIKTRNSIN